MSKLRVQSFTISIDGYGAGSDQSLQNPLGVKPVLLGSGEHLLHDINLCALGYECSKSIAGERATHVFLHKEA